MKKNIFISCDHGGFYLKEQIIQYLLKKSFKIIDLGTKTPSSVDYPDYSEVLVNEIKNNLNYLGILLCGTGIGMSIAANKFAGIRAANVSNKDTAIQSVEHNNVNVLTLGSNNVENEHAMDIITAFLSATFSKEERYSRRINKLAN